MLLEKRVAIVTGAASGIGRAVALAYAREGAHVVVSDVNEAGGRETIDLARSQTRGARMIFVRADASSPEDNQGVVRAAIEEFGALHVACNNAGIGSLHPVGRLGTADESRSWSSG